MLRLKTEADLHKLGLRLDPADRNTAVLLHHPTPPQEVPLAEIPDVGNLHIAEKSPQIGSGDDTSPQRAESCTCTTSAAIDGAGAVGDISNLDDPAVLAGMKAECSEIRTLDANYAGKYHRLGTYIIESTKRFGDEMVRQTLRGEGIDRSRAYYAKEIARLYTYEQAVQFASFRAIKKTIPAKQPRKKKPQAAVPPEPPPVLPPDSEETILDSFIQLGIQVKELLGEEALEKAVEQIKTHVGATFDEVFVEI